MTGMGLSHAELLISHRVTRLICHSENYGMELVIDINTLLYPMDVGDRFTCALARTLHEDGVPDDRMYDQSREPSLADKFEYVMHGHVFRCDEDKQGKLFVWC